MYTRNIIFKKKNPSLRFWIIFYFGPNFVFWGIPLGRFSKYYFLFFVVGQPWWPTFLLSSLLPHTHPHPYHKKKLRTALILCRIWFLVHIKKSFRQSIWTDNEEMLRCKTDKSASFTLILFRLYGSLVSQLSETSDWSNYRLTSRNVLNFSVLSFLLKRFRKWSS